MEIATRHYWEENGNTNTSSSGPVNYKNYNSNEGFVRDQRGPKDQLNFAAHSEDEVDYQAPPGGFFKKGKVSRQDPMSHRIIEKRRRDRMNNCLADLSRLIPPEYLKKGRGRIEKTEIIEMAIRHVKHLQDRTHGSYQTPQDSMAKPDSAAERQSVADSSESYRAGFQDAIAEAVRFMVERQGHRPGDSCCVQLAKHLHTHLTKGEPPRENLPHSNGSSSESGSNSYSSNYQGQNGVMNGNEPEMYQQSPPYDQASAAPQTMECDRVYGKSSYPAQSGVMTSNEPTTAYDQASAAPQIMDCDRMAVGPISLTTRNGEYGDVMQAEADAAQAQAETARGSDAAEDYMQSYKFKNSIERRFSQTQDCEASDMSMRSTQSPSLKRRRVSKPAPYSSTTTSNSGSTEGPASNSPQDTSSDSLHMHVFEKLSPPATQYVPIFALNALGKHYVPLNIDYSCLSRHLGPYDMQDSQGGHIHTPLHPVTIHVNFQPCLLNRLKCEPHDREWRAE